jgi:hypothetical protein
MLHGRDRCEIPAAELPHQRRGTALVRVVDRLERTLVRITHFFGGVPHANRRDRPWHIDPKSTKSRKSAHCRTIHASRDAAGRYEVCDDLRVRTNTPDRARRKIAVAAKGLQSLFARAFGHHARHDLKRFTIACMRHHETLEVLDRIVDVRGDFLGEAFFGQCINEYLETRTAGYMRDGLPHVPLADQSRDTPCERLIERVATRNLLRLIQRRTETLERL